MNCILSASAAVDPTEHLIWVEGVAKAVAKRYHLTNRADIDDLNSAGVLVMLEVAKRFSSDSRDREGAFRGYAHRHVKTACQREAQRILNGGTYHTRRPLPSQQPVIARRFSDLDSQTDSDGPYDPSESVHTHRFRNEG